MLLKSKNEQEVSPERELLKNLQLILTQVSISSVHTLLETFQLKIDLHPCDAEDHKIQAQRSESQWRDPTRLEF